MRQLHSFSFVCKSFRNNTYLRVFFRLLWRLGLICLLTKKVISYLGRITYFQFEREELGWYVHFVSSPICCNADSPFLQSFVASYLDDCCFNRILIFLQGKTTSRLHFFNFDDKQWHFQVDPLHRSIFHRNKFSDLFSPVFCMLFHRLLLLFLAI